PAGRRASGRARSAEGGVDPGADRFARDAAGRAGECARRAGPRRAPGGGRRTRAQGAGEDALSPRVPRPPRVPPPHGGAGSAHHPAVDRMRDRMRGGEPMLLSLYVRLRTRIAEELAQTTAEYALVILAAAAVAVVLIAWARSSGKL